MISLLQHKFGDYSPNVEDALCLNRRTHRAGCTRCADGCPTAAISLSKGQPSVSDADCVHCGLCIQICPTDVFGETRRSERMLLRTATQLPPGPVGLVCPLRLHPGSTRMPVDHVVRHSRCLAALSPLQLIALAANGERPLWMDDSACAECPVGDAWATLARSVTTANRLLSVTERPPAVHLSSTDTNWLREEPVKRAVIDGEQTQFPRRNLFTGLGKLLQEGSIAAQKQAKIPAPPTQTGIAARLPYRIPDSRRTLLVWLEESAPTDSNHGSPLALVATDGLPFADVRVDPAACSGCGLCARFCPTAALTFDGDIMKRDELPGPFLLTFHPALCIDCDICAKICPDQALTYGDDLPPHHLRPTFSRTLMDGDLVACAVCGSATAQRSEDAHPICHVCRSGEVGSRLIQDKAGFLAELLRKLPPSNRSGEP